MTGLTARAAANTADAEMIDSTTLVARARKLGEIVSQGDADVEEIFFADEATTAIETK